MDINSLPFILCGPILRRLDSHQASVFIALRHPRTVTLTIYAAPEPGQPLRDSLATVTAATITVGRYLHIAVLTAWHSGDGFTPIEHVYNLQFAPLPQPDPLDKWPGTTNLAAHGLLTGDTPLGYDSGALPTFAGPPADLGDLRIIHGSCRKPHGPGRDMLAAVDTIIAASRRTLRRPHQLFLTGDQIYADDVDAEMLRMASELGATVLGWDPKAEEVLPLANKKREELIGQPRGTIIKKLAKFSSGECVNHLLALGEFVGMYLLVWCEAVWPATLTTWQVRYPADAARLKQLSDAGPLVSIFDERARADRNLLEAQKKAFDTRMAVLEQFRKDIRHVRRALANVPVFMIFDDHEVTDDWYLDKDWVTDVLGNELGRRLIVNALVAYAVFQAWGNDPRGEFATGQEGAKLLESLQALTQELLTSDGTKGKQYDENNANYNALRTRLRALPDVPRTGGVRWTTSCGGRRTPCSCSIRGRGVNTLAAADPNPI